MKASAADIARKLRNIRFNPPNGGAQEKLALINRHEANLLRSIGGSGRKTRLGVPSFSMRDDSNSANNGTQDTHTSNAGGGGGYSGGGGGGSSYTYRSAQPRVQGNWNTGGQVTATGSFERGVTPVSARPMARPMVAAQPAVVRRPMVPPVVPPVMPLPPNPSYFGDIPTYAGTVPPSAPSAAPPLSAPSAAPFVKDQSRIPVKAMDRLPGMTGGTPGVPAYNSGLPPNATYTQQRLNDIRHNGGWIPDPVDAPRPMTTPVRRAGLTKSQLRMNSIVNDATHRSSRLNQGRMAVGY